jgi:hypothetical protein
MFYRALFVILSMGFLPLCFLSWYLQLLRSLVFCVVFYWSLFVILSEWTQVLRQGKLVLLHMWHPSCYSWYKPSDKWCMRNDRWNVSISHSWSNMYFHKYSTLSYASEFNQIVNNIPYVSLYTFTSHISDIIWSLYAFENSWSES